MKPQHKVNHFFKSQDITHDPQQLNRQHINQTTTKHQEQKQTKAKSRRYLKSNCTYIRII